MNKDDWLVVIVRGFGVYLLVLALLAVPVVVDRAVTALYLWGYPAPSMDADETMTKYVAWALGARWGGLIASIIKLGLCFAFGLHMLRGGRLLFRLAKLPFPSEHAEPINAPDAATAAGGAEGSSDAQP